MNATQAKDDRWKRIATRGFGSTPRWIANALGCVLITAATAMLSSCCASTQPKVAATLDFTGLDSSAQADINKLVVDEGFVRAGGTDSSPRYRSRQESPMSIRHMARIHDRILRIPGVGRASTSFEMSYEQPPPPEDHSRRIRVQLVGSRADSEAFYKVCPVQDDVGERKVDVKMPNAVVMLATNQQAKSVLVRYLDAANHDIIKSFDARTGQPAERQATANDYLTFETTCR